LKKYKVPFVKPHFPDARDVTEDYRKILDANWFTNFGPFEQKFSDRIARYIGPDYYACTFSSATVALIAGVLAALGKGSGEQYIIMPSFTFVAGADALTWCGYKPLFVDIEPEGFHMDIAEVSAALEDESYKGKISGILFCNAFGVGTSNIDVWERLAESKHLPLIIDSAAGFGSLYPDKKKVGSAGLCEIFSFHATKPFAIGEGGAVVSRNKELIENLKSIQNFGFLNRNAKQLGLNGKLQEINAAIGLRQFEHLDTILGNRRSVLARYKAGLNPKHFKIQKNANNASLCFAAVKTTDKKTRDKCLKLLLENGVEARAYYSPSIHKQPYFQKSDKYSQLKITEEVDDRIISLPIHDQMKKTDVNLVISTLNRAAEA